jgi:hypothetical protein
MDGEILLFLCPPAALMFHQGAVLAGSEECGRVSAVESLLGIYAAPIGVVTTAVVQLRTRVIAYRQRERLARP